MIIETNGRRRSREWWLPSGVTVANVQAAYQFKGAASETSSYYNLVDSSKYQLSKSNYYVAWTIDKGTFIPATCGAGLTGFNQGYVSCAVKFSDVDVDANTEVGLVSPDNGYYLFAKTASGASSYYKTPGFSTATTNNQSASRSSDPMSSGVLGYTRSLGKLYQNGQSKTLTTYTWTEADMSFYVSIGNGSREDYPLRTMGTVYIQAAVFYSVTLSDSQHAELAEKMNAI